MKLHYACGLFSGGVREDSTGLYISGVATTLTMNRLGDTVIPKGAQFSLPMPLLWQHDLNEPVGQVIAAEARDNDIPVSVFMPRPKESQILIDRYKLAAESVRLGLVRGLSVGFTSKFDDVEIDRETLSMTFRKWNWHELSLVTVPANEEATIHTVAARAFGGVGARALPLPPAASAAPVVRLERRNSQCVYLKDK